MTPASGHLDIGPDRFPYLEAGAGPPLLFVHGVPGDRRVWQAHIEALAPQFRCIALTQRWFGAEQWRADGPAFGTATAAADLAAFVAALDAGPVALVAWSWGAHGALAAAASPGHAFERLLVYEPGFPTWIDDPDELAAFRADAGAAFAPVFAAEGEERLRRMIDVSGGAGFYDRLDPEQRRIQRDSLGVVDRLAAQTPPVPLGCADLAAIAPPVTVAWGERSRPLFALTSRAAARCIGGDRHREIAGAGHMWPIEDPAAFARFVAGWMNA